MSRRIVTAREQFAMLTPWLREAAWQPYETPPHMRIDDYGGDSHGGEYFGSKVAWDKATGDKMGYLDYTHHPEHGIHINMIEVHPDHRRKGVATELLNAVKHDIPGEPVDAGMTTPEGTAWWGAINKTATPWHSKPGDPTYRVPTQDLQRHRQFNPSIETPEQMHRSLWTKSWDKDTPEYRNFRTDNFSSGGSSEGSTEEGLVEGFESGAKFPPTEITTNGVGAMLTDGNHRVNVADMMSHPDLESYIHYDPHAYGDESYPSQVDPESELGKHIHKLVQNHPYEPVEGGPTTDHVFRRHPATGEWQRGQVDHSAQPYFVDTPQDLQRMKRKVPGFKDQGLGNYFDVDWGNGPEITHERHMHARFYAAGRAEDMHEYRTERHRQEVELEGLTGGHPADIADHFARGGTPLITYKDWLKSKAIGPGEQAASEEEFDPDYVHAPGRGWADMDDEPPW